MARKTSFYYAFLVLPRDQRRAIVAVWDFCRAVDDAVDEPDGGAPAAAPSDSLRSVGVSSRWGWPPSLHFGEPGRNSKSEDRGQSASAKEDGGDDHTLVSREAVNAWREELARCYDGGAPRTPQGQRLQPFIAPFDLPRQAFEDVIDGVAMDIETTRYQTFADLLEYCHRVASAVGMICIRIFGCRSNGARDYALNLGVALQLTNIIRDVRSDLDRGRVYLPLEDLAAAGCTVDDLAAGRMSDPVRCLIQFECRRARDFYDRAVRARPDEDRRRLVAAEIMRAVYFETLRRIESRGYDVFSADVRVPRPRQAFIALRQWLWEP